MHYKGLKKENLCNNMTNLEMDFNILVEGSVKLKSPNNVPHKESNNRKRKYG